MGAGLALQFKKRYPDMFKRYQSACQRGKLNIGKIYPIIIPSGIALCFPTKRHYKDPSQLDYISQGLIDLVRVIHSYQIDSIVIPALGCGLGDLQWSDVEPLIVAVMIPLSNTRVMIYPPH